MAASRETSSYCAVIICSVASVRSDGVGAWRVLMGFYRGWIDDGSEGRSKKVACVREPQAADRRDKRGPDQ